MLRKKMLKATILGLAGLLAVALATAACGGNGGETSAPASQTQPQPAMAPAAAAPAPTAAAGQSIIPGSPQQPASAVAPQAPPPAAMAVEGAVERLVFASAAIEREDISTPNIFRTNNWKQTPMYENLVDIDPVTGQALPYLATDWSVSEEEMRFTLRQGVQFHNGWGEFTAKDVEHMYWEMAHPDTELGTGRNFRNQIDGVVVVNDYEVVMPLIEPNPILFRAISQYQEIAVINSKAHFDEFFAANQRWPEIGEEPIAGTGPYQYDDIEEGSYLRYRRVPGTHYRDQVDFEELELRWIPEASTRMASLLTEEVHIANLPTDLASEAVRRGMKNVDAQASDLRMHIAFVCCHLNDREDPSMGYIYGDDIPMMDIRIRRAISKAIDREVLNQAFFGGNGQLAVMNGYKESTRGWNPEWAERYPEQFGFDPDAARALLAEAGYGPDNPYELTFIFQTSLPEGPDVIETTGRMLEDVGIGVKFESMDAATARARARNWEFDNHLFLRTGGRDIFSWLLTEASQNFHTSWHFVLPEFNTLQPSTRSTMVPAEHERLFREAGNLAFDSVQHVPLLWLPRNVTVNPEIVESWIYPGSGLSWSHFYLIRAVQ